MRPEGVEIAALPTELLGPTPKVGLEPTTSALNGNQVLAVRTLTGQCSPYRYLYSTQVGRYKIVGLTAHER